MYDLKNYIHRGSTFVNNKLNPRHKKLSTLMIYATDICDSGCKHCLIWAKRPTKVLPLEKIIEIMNSKCVTKNTTIGLEGGEFLLHPEALEIMKWFRENHPNFDLLSNCLKPDNLIEAVKKYPPKRLYVSLDGDKDTYLYMRGKDGYESVIKVIEELKDVVPISTMFTLSPYNEFSDMDHVANVCEKYGIDMRIGVYNNISFFDTVETAHENDIGQHKDEKILQYADVREIKQEGLLQRNAKLKEEEAKNIHSPIHNHEVEYSEFKDNVPHSIKKFKENYDFLMLYDEWRKKRLKMKCHSILDSAVVHPNGDVPICQHLDVKIGNVFENTLDEVFNSDETIKTHNHHVHNCNQCWINFHRKYDVVLYRTFEKFFGKVGTSKLLGYYQWEEDNKSTYKEYMDKVTKTYV